MSRYEIRPFTPEHYVSIFQHAYSWGVKLHSDPAKLAVQFYEGGPAFSGFYDDALLGCVGLVVPWAGLGYAWAVIAPLALQHPLWVHRRVKQGLDSMIEASRLRRVEATVSAEVPRNLKWIEKLGFVKESEMPDYGPKGETFVKYVRRLNKEKE